MNTRLIPLLAFWICSSTASYADGLPDYIRFAEDDQSARLEVAIKTFKLPSGQKVDLVGAVHIADGAYYQELNQRFAAYDSVLFELVGDPKRLAQDVPQSGGGAISSIQQAAAKYLNLTFQLGAIDYSGKNMVHADATAEEFERMQKERGETTLTLFARAMQAQLNGQLDPAATNALDTFGLIRILMSPDSATAFKKALAQTFDQTESMTAAMEGQDGSVILGGRNDLVAKRIKEVLARKRQRHIAVFYGAAHMPGIESLLTRDFKAKDSGEEWVAAWTMPKITTPRVDTNPERGTATPASSAR